MTRTHLCQYLSNEGKVCGRPCYRQEGCTLHWKRRHHVPCSQCDKITQNVQTPDFSAEPIQVKNLISSKDTRDKDKKKINKLAPESQEAGPSSVPSKILTRIEVGPTRDKTTAMVTRVSDAGGYVVEGYVVEGYVVGGYVVGGYVIGGYVVGGEYVTGEFVTGQFTTGIMD
ncbi:hypothetical protein Glove_49g15 [Diversispora epigaea]|uniref:Uncharacterized protein n=1 Tax=Diversispora epigaea TaxID=1348612 RepID=A0A397JQ10_9GLOM|nr:hypothetical protein Glove_49g15 [Diversispora epigaea]